MEPLHRAVPLKEHRRRSRRVLLQLDHRGDRLPDLVPALPGRITGRGRHTRRVPLLAPRLSRKDVHPKSRPHLKEGRNHPRRSGEGRVPFLPRLVLRHPDDRQGGNALHIRRERLLRQDPALLRRILPRAANLLEDTRDSLSRNRTHCPIFLFLPSRGDRLLTLDRRRDDGRPVLRTYAEYHTGGPLLRRRRPRGEHLLQVRQHLTLPRGDDRGPADAPGWILLPLALEAGHRPDELLSPKNRLQRGAHRVRPSLRIGLGLRTRGRIIPLRDSDLRPFRHPCQEDHPLADLQCPGLHAKAQLRYNLRPARRGCPDMVVHL